jgi:hypothetical protein
MKQSGERSRASGRNRAVLDGFACASHPRFLQPQAAAPGKFRLFFNEVFTITRKAVCTGGKRPDQA